MRKTILAALSFVVFASASTVASAQVCVVGIFIAAAVANSHAHRELTSKEAMTCGLSYMFEEKKEKKEQPPKKRMARRAKHQ